MKKNLLFILLSIISTISYSQIRISGTVIDAKSKAPLSKTIVSLNGADNTIITDAAGFFTVVLKESGIYEFSVSKNGYKSLAKELILNESIEIQISLTSEAEYTSTNTPKKEVNYLAKDEYSKSKKAREEKERAEKKAKEERLAQEKLLADKKNNEAQRYQKELEARKKAIADKKAQEQLLASRKRLEAEKKLMTEKDASKSKKQKVVASAKKKTLYNLSGFIRDKFTKKEISNAFISFDGIKKTFITNNNGLFDIEIPAGDYAMLVTAPNFYSETANVLVEQDLDFTILMTKDSLQSFTTADVVISGTRATDFTPTTFRKISKEEINENNLGKDLPYLLELTPSVVASSDGGNGTGYTSMRIRGSDMTRINFTINGFPVNDAESQGVFLVNTPDLASDAKDIQIQRGIGTSTNGAGAFGASVNINTNDNRKKPYAEINNSFGSFMTVKNTIKAGTGELFNHFSFDGRFSHLMTDGFIDRAEAQMFAYALNAAYFNKKSIIRFNVFAGKEKTYQAWNGVDKDQAENDRTFNSAGTDYGQKEIPHDNETDNYNQTNYQLSLSHQFTNRISANLGFHYTKGSGYFEQYKVDEDILEYGVASSTSSTDLIRRRWLDNDFYGSIFSVAYKAKNIHATLGGGWNQYDGDHFGEIIWAKEAKDIEYNQRYYDNTGLKTDFNTFLKAEYTIKRFVLFGDVQYRRVSYSVHGIDNDQRALQEDVDYNFVNPKVGITYLMGENKNGQLYASFAMANREPTRNDFIDNDEDPKPENMMDFELGYRTKSKKLNFGANAFYMKYKNQLVLTGELNDVGSAVRANVDNSFRTGIEAELAYEPFKFFGINTTATWSLNEIEEFTFVDYTGTTVTHDKTKISYSPAFTGNLTLYTKPFKGFKFGIINKFVSEQFLDNTSTKANTLAAYYLMDARASYSINPKFMNEIELIFKVNNITNTKYSTNGYTYYDSPYFYPQAGTNFEGGVNLKF